LPDCSIMCDIKGNLLSLDNNYLLTKLILLGYFLLRLNMSICLLHSICKKFHCLFVLYVLLQILTALFTLYFSFVNNKSFLNGIVWIVFILLSFLESKSSFLMSFLFLLCYLFVQISIIFIHKIYTKFLIENMIGIVIFPICQYLIIVIFNLCFNIKIMRFMPVNLKYALYLILNSCFEGFKSGMYFISSENGFANFHFIILLFFDIFMNFAKKYKLFERCLTTLISICNEKFKSQITETDRLNDIANIETQLFTLASLIFLIYKKFIYFAESYIFNDCMGTPNLFYFNPNKNSNYLIILLAVKIILVFVLSNFIFPKCFKTSIYYIPIFKGFMQNYTKFSVSLYALIKINVLSIYYGLFYYKFYILNNKQINF